MFEWLDKELADVKTPRFHVVDGPADPTLRVAVSESDMPLPASYKEFVLRFGNAKLYRRADSDSYRIGVFAGPREAVLRNGNHVYHLGFHDGASVYVKPDPSLRELPVFEFEAGAEERVAESFEEWLEASCLHARNAYGQSKWAEILRGPEPFGPAEEQMLQARRAIRWRVLGVDMEENHIFEITNSSSRVLPVLTVGVRSRDGRLNGAVLLKIGHVEPGQMAVLHVACYKGLRPPEGIEVFALPEPQPEDRERYAEFRYV